MKVPFTVADFLNRAVAVYGDRVGVVDEPGVVGSLGVLTYAEMGSRVRGMARRLEDMGIGVGDRVAIVSPNSAKFLLSFWGRRPTDEFSFRSTSVSTPRRLPTSSSTPGRGCSWSIRSSMTS